MASIKRDLVYPKTNIQNLTNEMFLDYEVIPPRESSRNQLLVILKNYKLKKNLKIAGQFSQVAIYFNEGIKVIRSLKDS